MSEVILTSKQRAVLNQRKYREKLKNDAEYKKKQAEYMVSYRAKVKEEKGIPVPIKVIPIYIPFDMPVLIRKENTVPHWKSANNDKGFTPEYKTLLINNLKKVLIALRISYSEKLINVIASIYDSEDIKRDIKYIRNEMPYLKEDVILDFLNLIKKQYPNNNTLRTYILPFIHITSRLKTYQKSYQIISRILQIAKKIYDDDRDKNEIKLNEIASYIDYNPIALNTKLNEITTINEKFLFAIYTLLIPRRLEWNNVKISKVDIKRTNVIILDYENPNNTKIIFNIFKTSDWIGTQILENLPLKMLSILYEYLEANNKKDGDYLFTQTNSPAMLDTPAFSLKITNLFSTIYKANITNRFLRMACASYHDSLHKSTAYNKSIALAMSHSLDVHLQYIKKFVEDDDIGKKIMSEF
jgi:hypothetical protein